MRKKLALSAMLAFSAPVMAQHAAHEHGVADLRVAADGNTVVIEFDSPLANVVGFEHAPRDDKQRDALRVAEDRLAGFGVLFALTSAAGCSLQEMQIESPYPRGEDGHGHHDHDHGGEHDHDVHDDRDHGHADIYAVYELECADIAALEQIEVRIIEIFPRITTLRVETATASGQQSLRVREPMAIVNF